jgi:hypothetical protein
MGEFVEFESVINPETNRPPAAENLNILLKMFERFSMTPVPESYADLLMNKEI